MGKISKSYQNQTSYQRSLGGWLPNLSKNWKWRETLSKWLLILELIDMGILLPKRSNPLCNHLNLMKKNKRSVNLLKSEWLECWARNNDFDKILIFFPWIKNEFIRLSTWVLMISAVFDANNNLVFRCSKEALEIVGTVHARFAVLLNVWAFSKGIRSLFSSYLEVKAIDLADTARVRQALIGLECGSLRSENIETFVILKLTFVYLNESSARLEGTPEI